MDVTLLGVEITLRDCPSPQAAYARLRAALGSQIEFATHDALAVCEDMASGEELAKMDATMLWCDEGFCCCDVFPTGCKCTHCLNAEPPPIDLHP